MSTATKSTKTKSISSSEKLKKELAELKKKQSELDKSEKTILKKIELEEKKNKPKSIMDRVKNMKDVFAIAKPSKEELAIINYSGKSKRLLLAKHSMVLGLIAEVLNEGHVFKMDASEYRYYPYFYLSSSGFVFEASYYNDSDAGTSSASRLCFKNREISDYAGKTFLKEFKAFIMEQE